MGKEYNYTNTELIDIDGEDWIDVIGFDGMYEVSNYGRVKSVGRFVQANGGGEMWIKQRILKQAIGTSSLIATLCVGGVCKRFIVARLVFFSFNYRKKNLAEYFIIHKDNDWRDNSLDNVKIGTKEERAKLTFLYGKHEHLKLGNPMLSKHNRSTAKIVNGEIVFKTCTKCGEEKEASKFRQHRNGCLECAWEDKRKKIGTKKRRCKGLRSTCQVTGDVVFYKNYNDNKLKEMISTTSAIKHVKNKTICSPYLKKHSFHPFRLIEI